MFEFTSKIRVVAIVLVILGVISVGASFFTGDGAHGSEHHEDNQAHAQHDGQEHGAHSESDEALKHGDKDYHKTAAQSTPENNTQTQVDAMQTPELTHHQAQNKPWANLLTNGFFFLAIAAGALFFLAVQYAAQAGWTVVLLRVMEAIAQFIWVPLVVLLLIAIASVFHIGGNHIYHWLAEGITDPQSSHYDEIIAGKSGYLNGSFFLLRTVLYVVLWSGAAFLLRKLSKGLDQSGVDAAQQWTKMRKWSVGFLAIFAITSTTSAWDFIMSIDTHWYSTLFGWYVFAGMFITALTTIMLIVIFLKRQGYLQEVNKSHIHDMAKFMFAFSVFWAYLWFSQYMLIWYSNKPEESAYFLIRFMEFKGLLITMLVMNFVFPILVLMSRDSKRNFGFILTAGIVILLGHWIDVYLMIYPGTVGATAGISLINVGTFLGFLGLFMLVVFRALSKAPLIPENHPMYLESKYHHI